MSRKQKKILMWFFLLLGISCWLFIIIFIPCFTELIFVGERNDLFTVEIVLMTLLPFNISISCFLSSYILREFTMDDMIRSLDKGFERGTMDIDTYRDAYHKIALFDVEKKRLQAKTKLEIAELQAQINNEAKATAQKIHDQAQQFITKPVSEQELPDETTTPRLPEPEPVKEETKKALF